MIEKKYILHNLSCASCAAKIEDEIRYLNGVEFVSVNFMQKTMKVSFDDSSLGDRINHEEFFQTIKKIATSIEGDIVLEEKQLNSNNHSFYQNDVIQRNRVVFLVVALLIFLAGIVTDYLEVFPLVSFTLFAVSYLISGFSVLKTAAKNIIRGEIFDENFLMAIATIGAFIIGEYPEGVAVMLFYQFGELFQDYAVKKSRKSISDLMDIRPDYANLEHEGELIKVSPENVKVGDIIVVKPGEKIPLDGIVLEGNSMLDTVALTGESIPREVTAGNDVLSGCININGVLAIRVTKPFGESTVSKILELVENAGSKKAQTEKFITKFARYYTPFVVIIATMLTLIPPLILEGATFREWSYRALVFLVISCPCALVISVPLGFFGGIGGASKLGILIKGGNYLEALSKVQTVIFDKTGTLTKGVFKVTEIHTAILSKEELLEITALAESYSNHPISLSLKEAYGDEIDKNRVTENEELIGLGVRCVVDGKTVYAGNAELMRQIGIGNLKQDIIGTGVYVAIDGVYAGCIVISDEIKEDSRKAMAQLKELNIRQTVMLTGDNKSVGGAVATELGLDKVYTGLLPVDKVEKLEMFLAEKSGQGTVAFVGDGINDAPVLALADIGIAMGGLGADAAIEAADIVIMTDEPSRVATAIKVAKKTMRIVKSNIIFSLAVKFIVLALGALGYATMWAAVFADVGVSVIAIINSMRGLRVKNIK